LFCIGGKRSRYCFVQQQLAKGAHDEEHDQPAHGIGHHQSWSSLLNRRGRTEKQTDADRSANRDHLDVPGLEAPEEVFFHARLHSSRPLPLWISTMIHPEYAVLKQVLGTAIRFYVDESLYAARRWRAGVPDPRGCSPG